jgi:hypothetical protein
VNLHARNSGQRFMEAAELPMIIRWCTGVMRFGVTTQGLQNGRPRSESKRATDSRRRSWSRCSGGDLNGHRSSWSPSDGIARRASALHLSQELPGLPRTQTPSTGRQRSRVRSGQDPTKLRRACRVTQNRIVTDDRGGEHDRLRMTAFVGNPPAIWLAIPLRMAGNC